MGDRLRVDQSADRLVRGNDRRERDHGHDEDPGQVLGPTVSVGVAAVRRAPAQDERDPQGYCGQRVGEVVDGVRQECDRPGEQDNDQLGDRRDAQGDQADLDRPDPLDTGLKNRVDRVGRVVAVRAEDRAHETLQSGHLFMVVMVTVCRLLMISVTVVTSAAFGSVLVTGGVVDSAAVGRGVVVDLPAVLGVGPRHTGLHSKEGRQWCRTAPTSPQRLGFVRVEHGAQPTMTFVVSGSPERRTSAQTRA